MEGTGVKPYKLCTVMYTPGNDFWDQHLTGSGVADRPQDYRTSQYAAEYHSD